MIKVGVAPWAILGCMVTASCGTPSGQNASGRTEERLEARSPHAAQIVEQARQTFRVPRAPEPLHRQHRAGAASDLARPLLPAGTAGGFVRRGDTLEPRFPPPPGERTDGTPVAQSRSPTKANAPLEIRDVPSGLSIQVTLIGASGANVEVAGGYLVYPAAYEGTADVMNRPYSSGTEQTIVFASRPASERIIYEVELGRAVAGVRLVADAVEFLDSKGAPRLRMAPPFVAGDQATSTWPSVALSGCAVDRNPAPPWDRPVVAPHRRHCQVSVDWSQAHIQYPAVLDPSWTVGQHDGRRAHAPRRSRGDRQRPPARARLRRVRVQLDDRVRGALRPDHGHVGADRQPGRRRVVRAGRDSEHHDGTGARWIPGEHLGRNRIRRRAGL
jgi:hypothetical protein